MDKRAASGRDILYLLQDMRDFELYGTVAAVVSICDCINYILEYDDRSVRYQYAPNAAAPPARKQRSVI